MEVQRVVREMDTVAKEWARLDPGGAGPQMIDGWRRRLLTAVMEAEASDQGCGFTMPARSRGATAGYRGVA
jgi:hypothetical protein